MTKGANKNKKSGNTKKTKVAVIILCIAGAAALITASYFLFFRNMIQYSVAVNQIENGNFKDGFDNLMDIAERDADYKDTSKLLYANALELIETGDIDNKKRAYDMLMSIPGYEHADDLIYFLWAEDAFVPEEENSYEIADQFIEMIPEDYDGPFADKIAQYREDINAAMDELNRKKAQAGMEEDAFPNSESDLQTY